MLAEGRPPEGRPRWYHLQRIPDDAGTLQVENLGVDAQSGRHGGVQMAHVRYYGPGLAALEPNERPQHSGQGRS